MTTADEPGLFEELINGLQSKPKHLPTKLLYDNRGSQLFDRITRLPVYYLTGCENYILRKHAQNICATLGTGVAVIEYGAGNMTKIGYLMEHLNSPAAYVPVDISHDFLRNHVLKVRERFPNVNVRPVVADFLNLNNFSKLNINNLTNLRRNVIFLSGSTIGNFTNSVAISLMSDMGTLVGPNGLVLVGFDLVKSPEMIERAYNDQAGVTAAFTSNILLHINRLWGSNFNLADFEPRAVYDCERQRVELFLVCLRSHTVEIKQQRISLFKGEKLVTEYSHKYSAQSFAKLAKTAGLTMGRFWEDDNGWYRIQCLESGRST